MPAELEVVPLEAGVRAQLTQSGDTLNRSSANLGDQVSPTRARTPA